MTILTEKYRFIRDDMFLCPWINTATGKQKLILQKINSNTNNVEFEDSINCIHTAVMDISSEDYVKYQNNSQFREDLQEKALNVRSSENRKEINLTNEEKFIALKSWAAGIAESGIEGIKIQGEIESIANLAYPISGFLLKFLVKVDPDFFHGHFENLKRECMFENVMHEYSFIANLIPFINNIYYRVFPNQNSSRGISDADKVVIDAIYKLEISFKAFRDNPKFLSLIAKVDSVYLKTYFQRIMEEYGSQIEKDEPSFVKDLFPFIEVIHFFTFPQISLSGTITETYKSIIEIIYKLDIKYKIFKDNMKFLKLIAKVDPDYFRNYLVKSDKEQQTENGNNESHFVENLISTIEMIHDDTFPRYSSRGTMPNIYRLIIEVIFNLERSYNAFKDNPKFLFLIAKADSTYLTTYFNRIIEEYSVQIEKDEIKLAKNLNYFINIIHSEAFPQNNNRGIIIETYELIIKKIYKLDVNCKLFKDNLKFRELIPKIDKKYLTPYFKRIIEDFNTQIEKDEPSFVKNLNSFIDIIHSGTFSQYSSEGTITESYKLIIEEIYKLDIDYKSFKDNLKFLKLITKISSNYFRNYLTIIDKGYQTENRMIKSDIIVNLTSIIEMVHDDTFSQSSSSRTMVNINKLIIELIFKLEKSYKTFKDNPKYLRLIAKVDPAYLNLYFKRIMKEYNAQIEKDELVLLNNLIFFIDIIQLDKLYQYSSDETAVEPIKIIIEEICKLDISYKIFKDNPKYLIVILFLNSAYLISYCKQNIEEYRTNKKNESNLAINLISIIDNIYSFIFSSKSAITISEHNKIIIKTIYEFEESFNILKDHFKYLRLIANVNTAYFREHLIKVEDECRTHNGGDEKKFTTFLENFINSFCEDSLNWYGSLNEVKFLDADKSIIKTIHEFIGSYKMIKIDPNFLILTSHVNPDYITVHLKNIWAVLFTQSKQWKSDFIAILTPTINNIYYNCFSEESYLGFYLGSYLSKSNETLLTTIENFEISYKLFKENPQYMRLISHVDRRFCQNHIQKIESDCYNQKTRDENKLNNDFKSMINSLYETGGFYYPDQCIFSCMLNVNPSEEIKDLICDKLKPVLIELHSFLIEERYLLIRSDRTLDAIELTKVFLYLIRPKIEFLIVNTWLIDLMVIFSSFDLRNILETIDRNDNLYLKIYEPILKFLGETSLIDAAREDFGAEPIDYGYFIPYFIPLDVLEKNPKYIETIVHYTPDYSNRFLQMLKNRYHYRGVWNDKKIIPLLIKIADSIYNTHSYDYLIEFTLISCNLPLSYFRENQELMRILSIFIPDGLPTIIFRESLEKYLNRLFE